MNPKLAPLPLALGLALGSAPADAAHLYVANPAIGAVTVYNLPAAGNAAPLVPYPALACPTDIVRSRTTALTYVANACNESITVYASHADGSVAPLRVIAGPSTQLSSGSFALALDGLDNLYVGQFNGSGGQILRFAAGATGDVAPTAVISGASTQLASTVTGLAIDAKAQIYATSDGNLLVFAAGASGDAAPVLSVGGGNAGLPRRIAVDGNTIYIGGDAPDMAPCFGGNAVITFAVGSSGNVSPLAQLCGQNTGFQLGGINGVSVENGVLFLADPGTTPEAPNPNPAVLAFHGGVSGNTPPNETILGAHTGLAAPSAVSADIAGRVFVANALLGGGSVLEFANLATGDATPIAKIANPPTGMARPAGVALDPSGQIYVTNALGASDVNAITIYVAGSMAATAPLASIAGAKTLLAAPIGIAVTPGGTVLAANNSGNSITAYAKGITGNVAPTYSLSGPNTLLFQPFGIAVGPQGRIYVTTDADNQLLEFGPNQRGNVAPQHSTAEGLNAPAGVAYDTGSNHLFVANQGGNSVTIYSGVGLALLGTIEGANTGLSMPVGIATDGTFLYVANVGNGTVTAYGIGAKGNVRPKAVLRGPKTLLNGLSLLAVGG